MNWLITGGCGFIGTNLVRRLGPLANNNVRIVDDLSHGTRSALGEVCTFHEVEVQDLNTGPTGVELLVGDVRDRHLAVEACRGVDAVIHLAANTGVQPSIEDPYLDCTTNVLGIVNYLEGARLQGVDHFVFASSGGTVIGDTEPPVHEDMVPRPKAPYGASKAAGEAYCSAYAGSFGVEAIALRFSNIYGPGSAHKNSVVARFIRHALEGRPLEIYGDGGQTRDFLFVDDLTDAITRAARSQGNGGHVFHVASGTETTINEIHKAVVRTLAEAGVTVAASGHTEPLRGEIRRNFSEAAKAKRSLGWEATTELEEGLRATVAWFLARGASASLA